MTERASDGESQLQSFETFKTDVLRFLFNEISPIQDLTGNRSQIRFSDPRLGEPRRNEEECLGIEATYAAPLSVNVGYQVVETGEVREQEIFIGDFPLMTPRGTFIVNGSERSPVADVNEVLENQLRRGLKSMAQTTRNRMAKTDPEIATPSSLISSRPFIGAIKRSLQHITATSPQG